MSVVQKIENRINYWWAYSILGVLFIIGSFYIFSTPGESYLALSIVFAVFMLFDGIGSIAFSISNRENLKGWGWLLASGILSVLIGVGLFMYPTVTMVVLPIFIGFWILMKGGMTAGAAFDLKSYGVGSWGWILTLGILVSILGFAMILNPVFGVSMIVVLTGMAVFFLGVAMIMLSMGLRKIKHKVGDIDNNVKVILGDIKASVEGYINKEPADVQIALKQLKSKVDDALADD